jgi:hypothetical protein
MMTTIPKSHLTVNKLTITIRASTTAEAMAAGKFLPALDGDSFAG